MTPGDHGGAHVYARAVPLFDTIADLAVSIDGYETERIGERDRVGLVGVGECVHTVTAERAGMCGANLEERVPRPQLQCRSLSLLRHRF